MGRICLTFTSPPETDRWVPGDRWVRPLARRILRGRPRPGGVEKVFINLCLGLDRLGVAYETNLPFSSLRPGDLLGVLGRGRGCLEGYRSRQPLVAGIGLMTHPSEWPTLFEDYPVACYLQHSPWAADVYRRHYGDRCATWPVGIDTQAWKPSGPSASKPVDFLIYEKFRWEIPRLDAEFLAPITEALRRRGQSFRLLRYGSYQPSQFQEALAACKAAIFLSSHESQGIACLEAMASDVPILAWDPGRCLDPARSAWGDPEIPASSVPFFSAACGLTFRDLGEFERQLPVYSDGVAAGAYAPRDFILEGLTVEKCSARFVEILREKLG